MSERSYYARPVKRRWVRRILVLLTILLLVTVAGVIAVQRWYYLNLRPISADNSKKYVTIDTGASAAFIGGELQKEGLIRSEKAFEWYISLQNARDKLQAGTYSLSPSESTTEIANEIIQGKVATDLVTILPGQRLDQIRQTFIKAGFNASAVDAALDAGNYRTTYPALADNPPTASLEGFLYPDSFQKNSGTDPKTIVEESLTEMQQHLTSDIRKGFADNGLTVYQGVTLASIVEQEVPGQTDRNQAAQVFLKRLKVGMQLGSDVTAFYGAIKAGVTPAVDYDSPYNTLLHKGFPPGPISTVSDSSLDAIAHPANTDWLYFVAGDDGKTYFAKTVDEHNANVKLYCHKLCGQAS